MLIRRLQLQISNEIPRVAQNNIVTVYKRNYVWHIGNKLTNSCGIFTGHFYDPVNIISGEPMFYRKFYSCKYGILCLRIKNLIDTFIFSVFSDNNRNADDPSAAEKSAWVTQKSTTFPYSHIAPQSQVAWLCVKIINHITGKHVFGFYEEVRQTPTQTSPGLFSYRS